MPVVLRPVPTGALRPGTRPRWVDVVVAVAVVAVFWGVLHASAGATGTMHLADVPAQVSTDPADLSGYALRSLLRMFAALAASVVFTFVVGTAAARSRRAGRIILPVLDILQSVPVLGFLTITVTGFIALFPGSMLGLESASVFAIFTAQVWNMTFAFHQSLVSQPAELDEAARIMRLTKWQRFWKLDVPGGMIPLVWNGMMSFGGSWFFLAASEAVTVNGRGYALPGVGSYAAAAVEQGKLGSVGWAVLTMVILVVGVNVLFWRPLTAWAERFRQEDTPAQDRPRSLVLDVVRRSSLPGLMAPPARWAARGLDHATRPLGLAEHPLRVHPARRRLWDVVVTVAVVVAVVAGGSAAAGAILHAIPARDIFAVFGMGVATLARVMVILVLGTVVWVPVGVWIGMNPRVSRAAQPVVQVLASFPANLLFPFLIAWFLAWHIPLNVGGILLMALGSQWYILFNVIAGASTIPTDLRQAMDSFGVRGLQRWRALILPAIFPAYVTGALTAAGGAWNASVVAEYVTYAGHTYTATGLGAYITGASTAGDSPAVLLGVIVMSVFVVGINALLWRPLYRRAATRFSF